MEQLRKENLTSAASFIAGPLWADMKTCLLDRRPEPASPDDLPHVAAAKGFQRSAWEACIAEIEKLPSEQGKSDHSPFDRPAITYTAD
jgi:hypothetical protein